MDKAGSRGFRVPFTIGIDALRRLTPASDNVEVVRGFGLEIGLESLMVLRSQINLFAFLSRRRRRLKVNAIAEDIKQLITWSIFGVMRIEFLLNNVKRHGRRNVKR